MRDGIRLRQKQEPVCRAANGDLASDHLFHGVHAYPHVEARIVPLRVLANQALTASEKAIFSSVATFDFAYAQLDGAANKLIRHIARAVQHQRHGDHFADFRQPLEVDFRTFGIQAVCGADGDGKAIDAGQFDEAFRLLRFGEERRFGVLRSCHLPRRPDGPARLRRCSR